MRYIFTFLILSFSGNTYSQECGFDPYQKKGGLYYFSTFYQNYDPNQLREGRCVKTADGKPYEVRELKNGVLQLEKLYQFGTNKVYSEFKRLKKDSIIAELIYGTEGGIEFKQTFYLNAEGKRCWREENYRQGKLWQVRYFRNFQNTELVQAGYASRPEHLIDSEGYCDVSAQFGVETMYHDNGKVMSIAEHKLIISDSPNSFPSQHGKYFFYSENGTEIQRGNYVNGAASGDFVYHHPNGRLSAKRSFENGIAVGHWEEFYDNGNLWTTIDYGAQYYWPTGHEKRYFKNGDLQFEKMIDSVGKGFQQEYFENGKLKECIIYKHGPQEKSSYYSWYESGGIRQKIYYRPQNDTASAEFYEDGFLKSINLQSTDYKRHEARTYFANHQLNSENIVERISDSVHQSHRVFSENGRIASSTEITGTKKVSKEYWSSGTLKFEKEFNNNLLSGYWIEQDSAGTVTKKCHYSNGFKDGCETTPAFKLMALDTYTDSLILPLAINAMARKQLAKNVIIEENEITKYAGLLKSAIGYLNTYYPNFVLHVPPRIDTSRSFHYYFAVSADTFARHAKTMDSLFRLMNWKATEPLKTQNKISFARFSSTSFYSISALDSIFNGVLPKGSGAFTLENRIYGYYAMDYYPMPSLIDFIRREKEQAWVVSIDNTQVVVYDDGLMELYNGTVVLIDDWGSEIMHGKW